MNVHCDDCGTDMETFSLDGWICPHCHAEDLRELSEILKEQIELARSTERSRAIAVIEQMRKEGRL